MASIDKILRNTGAEIEVAIYVDGVATDFDALPTVTVVNPDGTTLQTGTATDATVDDGKYEFSLDPVTTLKRLRASWVGLINTVATTIVTEHEIIGAHLFAYVEILTHESELGDTERFPIPDVIAIREEVTDFFAVVLGTSPVPRGGYAIHDGTGNNVLYLAEHELTAVIAATVGGVAVADPATNIAFWPSGRLYREDGLWTSGRRNITVEYEYGISPTPGPLARAAMVFATSLLVGSDIMDRSITATDETGTYRLSVPNAFRDNPTGIPYVDSVLNSYREDWVVIT